ncbi:MAG: hypothetical protein ABL984_13365 [Pyrinomonadaceae bacterium]
MDDAVKRDIVGRIENWSVNAGLRWCTESAATWELDYIAELSRASSTTADDQ